MPTGFPLRGCVALALLLLPACDRTDAPLEGAVAEVAERVEPIDPALIEALPVGGTEEMLVEGRELYVVCSVCHGLDGRGTPLGPSLRDTVWIHIGGSVEEIAALTRSGVPTPAEFEIPMPEMGGGDFNDEQLRSLATYVYALAHSGE